MLHMQRLVCSFVCAPARSPAHASLTRPRLRCRAAMLFVCLELMMRAPRILNSLCTSRGDEPEPLKRLKREMGVALHEEDYVAAGTNFAPTPALS